MTNIFIAIVGALLVGFGLVYGHKWTESLPLMRWPLYGACSCIATGAVWLKLLPVIGLDAPGVAGQIGAILLATVAAWWFMERCLLRSK